MSNITSSGAAFTVFPPTAFDIAEGGLVRNVEIGFSPDVAGPFNGVITFNSNADNDDLVLIAVSGQGVEPALLLEPDIDVNDSIDFGAFAEETSVNRLLTIRNVGDAPLNVSDISSNNLAFAVSALGGDSLPFTLAPGGAQNVSVVFTAPSGTAGTTINGKLTINSNDPDGITLRDIIGC